MRIESFALERWMTHWETRVRYDLAESGIQPMSVRELGERTGELDRIDEILAMPAGYSEACGTVELRSLIADLYDNTKPENVLVTTGAIEANYVLFNVLLESADEVIVVDPCYQQLASVPKAIGCTVHPWSLRSEADYAYELDVLESLVSERTGMIVINSPHNPTGSILTQDELKQVYDIAERVNAWVLSDEAYRWLTLPGQPQPAGPARDLGDHGISVGTLSKPFGMPGLRIGWLVAPEEVIQKCWAFRDYISLSPGFLNDRFAQIVLGHRETLMDRTLSMAKQNYDFVQRWIHEREGLIDWVAPRGGLLGMLHYGIDAPSQTVSDRLAEEASVMLAPGSTFGREYHLRIGFGANPEHFREGMGVAAEHLERMASEYGVRSR